MRVVGIDPSTVSTGYGIVEEDSFRQLSYVTCGVISTPSKKSLPSRLKKIHDALFELLETYRPSAIVIENTFLARNVQVALKLGQARGVVLLVSEMFGLPAYEYTPTQIKMSVTGYGAAQKSQVRLMVARILNHSTEWQESVSDDATDALACAICHLHSAKTRILMVKQA